MGRPITDKEAEYDRSDIVAMIESTKSPMEQALVATVYLTAGRISEILRLKRNHIIKADIDGKRYMVFKLKCLKKWKWIDKKKGITAPVSEWRNTPVEEEDPIAIYIVNYIKTLKHTQILFPFGRKKAWSIIKSLAKNVGIDIWPHLIIHMRSKEVVVDKNFSDLDLANLRGWSDTRLSKTYTKLNWRDLARKLGKGEE